MTIFVLSSCSSSTEAVDPLVLPGGGSTFTFHSIYIFPNDTDDSSSLESYTLTTTEKDVELQGRNCVRFTRSDSAILYINYLPNGNYAFPAYFKKDSVIWLEYAFGTRNTTEFVFTDSSGPGDYRLVKKDVMSVVGNDKVTIQDSSIDVVKLLIRKLRIENSEVTFSSDTHLQYAPALGMIVSDSIAPQGSNFGRRLKLTSYTLR